MHVPLHSTHPAGFHGFPDLVRHAFGSTHENGPIPLSLGSLLFGHLFQPSGNALLVLSTQLIILISKPFRWVGQSSHIDGSKTKEKLYSLQQNLKPSASIICFRLPSLQLHTAQFIQLFPSPSAATLRCAVPSRAAPGRLTGPGRQGKG